MRKTKFLLPLMLMLAVVMCLPAFAEGENLWYDGGFDNITYVEGTVHCANDGYRNFTQTWAHQIVTEGNGNTSLALAGQSGGQPAMSNAVSLNLSPNSTYKLSLKVKNDTAGDIAYLQIAYNATTGSEAFWNCTNLTTFEGTDDWTEYEIDLPSSANFIYFRSYNGIAGEGCNWILVDDISVVETSTIEIVSGGIWSDSGFDALAVNGENQAQNTDEYRYFSQPNWQSKKMVETNGNVYFRMTGSGSGNPMMRNKVAFDVDTTKKHVITFKASEMYDGSGSTESKVYVYFSNEAIDSGFTLISAAEAGTATAINYYVPDNASGDTSLEPTWHDVTYTIPVGVDFKYIYFLVPTGYIGLDDIAVTPVDVDVEPAVVAAGLMEREETDSLAFAAYVTNEAAISDFGFEVSATGDFTDAIVVSGCQAVADNGEFCGVDVEANYYMVRVNGIPSADYTVYVRAYAEFLGGKVYSQVASASANDVLDANP